VTITASFHIWAHCTYGWWPRRQDDPNGSPSRELEETTRASTYHVAEHHPTRLESLQPHTEWSSRPGSEPSSVEADVYVRCYALLVVLAKRRLPLLKYELMAVFKCVYFDFTSTHFSGPSRAINSVCVSICVTTIILWLNDLCPRHSAHRFILALSRGQVQRSRSYATVHGHALKNVPFPAIDAHCSVVHFWLFVKFFCQTVGITWSEGFLILTG